ncbi:MAG: beta-glucosidase BglX [Lachnospiraceae bacterium]|nr:beta-glucosidase BglX [Lachnospiraceae bacterium]
MEERKLKQLLNDMSLDEKIGQMVQIPGSFFEEDFVVTGPANFINYTSEELKLAGSVLSVIGADKLRDIQERFMEEHPHHIPLMFMADIINGYRTIFPIPLGQGASFNPGLSEKASEIAASESACAGLHVVFSPMVDLVRDARWGRVMESTGEDPYLNSMFAKAFVEGYQGKPGNDGHPVLTERGNLSACVKHFAAYGAPVAGRDYNTVELSERTLKEEYLPSYKAALDSGCEMVMTSFNVLSRIPATGNIRLMRDILRKEWGSEAVLISDWGAIGELVSHGVAKDVKEAAYMAIKAGVDIDMCTRCYSGNLKALAEEGRIEEELIDEAVLRILRLKNRLGLFEHPFKDADPSAEKKYILCEDNRKAAREAAAESFVLLKNEGILPLKDTETTAFIGPFADSPMIHGAWSIYADEKDAVSIKDGAEKAGFTSRFAKGCALSADYPLIGMGRKACGFIEEDGDDELIKEAVELAKASETVVLTVGELNIMSGEASSRGMLDIPKRQKRLLKEVSAVNRNIITVLFTGRPLDLREISELSKAILVVWQPGSEGGNAICDVLSGKKCPSGKLPMSFPYSVGQVPVYYGELSTGRAYKEGDENKFLSKYIDIPNSPLYPFGFGLGYSETEISDITLDKNDIRMGSKDSIRASVVLKNKGEREAGEVVQLYIHDEFASAARPVRELKGFQKVFLKPGEEKKIEFEITEDMLCFWGEDPSKGMTFGAEKGDFTVFIGLSSDTGNKASFSLS